MTKREELEKVKKEIQKNEKKYISKLKKKREKLQEEVDKEGCKELVGKTFVYKDNSYSCPKEKKDYWNVYMKVIGAGKDYGVDVLTVQKDDDGRITIETQRLNEDLMGYVPCKKSIFDIYFKKYSDEIKSKLEVKPNSSQP